MSAVTVRECCDVSSTRDHIVEQRDAGECRPLGQHVATYSLYTRYAKPRQMFLYITVTDTGMLNGVLMLQLIKAPTNNQVIITLIAAASVSGSFTRIEVSSSLCVGATASAQPGPDSFGVLLQTVDDCHGEPIQGSACVYCDRKCDAFGNRSRDWSAGV